MTRITGRHFSTNDYIGFSECTLFLLLFVCFFLFGQKKPEDDQPKLSKKKLRKMNRLSVAELKQVRTV